MLCNLSIKNVALISEAEIEFSEGLNVLSGETGAGKSVILDSLNFVLGAKADKSMIRYGEDYCLVSCVFKDYPEEVSALLGEFDIEESEQLAIKRKFDVKGGGYVKLNGENVTSSMLKKITAHLVDVHGQSEHYTLTAKNKQLECVDAVAEVDGLLQELSEKIALLKAIEKNLTAVGGDDEKRSARLDVLDYIINEISAAEIKEGEAEDLKQKREKLAFAEKITSALGSAYQAISADGGAVDAVNCALQALKGVLRLDGEYEKLYGRLEACAEELADVSERASDLLESASETGDLDADGIEKRLDLYKSFYKKYGATVAEINERLESAKAERDKLLRFDEEFAAETAKKTALRREAYGLCAKLSEKRREAASAFSSRVTEKLHGLGMPKAKFEVNFDSLPDLTEKLAFPASGLDEAEFMFSANAGEPLKPLSKIISGGEMSRFMLALKTQAQSACATYVFDEIDAGISGTTAQVVAKNFAEIALKRQIIAISHLPSIVAMSDSSLLIKKSEKADKTYTEITPLSHAEKTDEVVRLIGGEAGDQTAKAHAEHMISDADAFKASLK